MDFQNQAQVEHMNNLPPVCMTNPTYLKLIRGAYVRMRHYYGYGVMWENYKFPKNFIDDFNRLFYLQTSEVLCIICFAFLLTFIRMAFQLYVCKPLMSYLHVNHGSTRKKFQESFFKSLFYLCTWCYCFCVLFFDSSKLIQKPWNMWNGWYPGVAVPFRMKLIYFIECGFYLHSIYATKYMDIRRKDYYVMFIHHVLSIALILISYATRYYKPGLLVLLFHDLNDVFLEGTKVVSFLRFRDGKKFEFYERLTLVGFAVFFVSWFLTRLYFFPLRVIYHTMVTSFDTLVHTKGALYGFFNCMLLLLLILDLYWFYFIIMFLIRVTCVPIRQLDDTRDYGEHIQNHELGNRKKR